MKIQFERKDFLRQLKLAANVAAVRDVVPILQNVKITTAPTESPAPEITPLPKPSPFSLSPSLPAVDNPFSDSPNPFNSSSSIPIEQSPFSQHVPMTAIPRGSFCTYCGQPVHPTAAVCMACGTNPRTHRKFCSSCGAPLNEAQIIW